MEKRSIILFVVLFLAITIGMFVFAYLKRQESLNQPSGVAATSTATSTAPLVTRVDAKHYFSNGKHTFVGVVEMPTPCDLLTVTSRVEESMPETIVLDFSVINNADTCAQVVTPQRFMVEAQASSEAKVRAEWARIPIELNLIPAGPDEKPEDFELFIKG